MKKYIAAGLLLLASVSAWAYTLTSSDTALIDRVVAKVETSLVGKPDSAREKIVKSLERYGKKQKSERMKTIVQEVINQLQDSGVDGLFEGSQDSTTQNKQTFVQFREWGIELPFDKDVLSDLITKTDSHGIGFDSRTMNTLSKYCLDSSALGFIHVIQGTAANMDTYYTSRLDAGMIKQLDGLFLMYEGPQSPCLTPEESQKASRTMSLGTDDTLRALKNARMIKP